MGFIEPAQNWSYSVYLISCIFLERTQLIKKILCRALIVSVHSYVCLYFLENKHNAILTTSLINIINVYNWKCLKMLWRLEVLCSRFRSPGSRSVGCTRLPAPGTRSVGGTRLPVPGNRSVGCTRVQVPGSRSVGCTRLPAPGSRSVGCPRPSCSWQLKCSLHQSLATLPTKDLNSAVGFGTDKQSCQSLYSTCIPITMVCNILLLMKSENWYEI